MVDLYGIGNAVVDADVEVSMAFLSDEDLAVGHMTLIDSPRMADLVAKLEHLPMRRASGGSAANTIFAAQALGLSTTYTCKLADDVNGKYFLADMQAAGVDNSEISEAATDQRRSGQCLVMITPDGQRTMCTDLGVSNEMTPSLVNTSALASAQCLYIEGYLSSSEHNSQTAIYCHELARASNTQIALTLSDVSMVTFCRETLETMMGEGVDTLFCNAEEALAWASTDSLGVAIKELQDITKELYITLGANGAQVVNAEGSWQVGTEKVRPIDTNGAGDIFAGACLAARLRGASAAEAAKFANNAAAKVITQFGARLPSIADYQKLQSGS
ncbi:MAG: adenosine kinase [Proteobacteria bacterium]|nr:adenosine kinase [Pseudomonadota bacterium]